MSADEQRALAHRVNYGEHVLVTIEWPDGDKWVGLDATPDEIAGVLTRRYQITEPHPQQDFFHAPGICWNCDKARG